MLASTCLSQTAWTPASLLAWLVACLVITSKVKAVLDLCLVVVIHKILAHYLAQCLVIQVLVETLLAAGAVHLAVVVTVAWGMVALLGRC